MNATIHDPRLTHSPLTCGGAIVTHLSLVNGVEEIANSIKLQYRQDVTNTTPTMPSSIEDATAKKTVPES